MSSEIVALLERAAVRFPPDLVGDAYVKAVNERHEAELELLRRSPGLLEYVLGLEADVAKLRAGLTVYAKEEDWWTLIPVVNFYPGGGYGPGWARAVCGRRRDWRYGRLVDEDGKLAREVLAATPKRA